jgi:hypothetical protein
MTYTITNYSGTTVATVTDNTLDTTTTSIGLIGKNYPTYGTVLNDNLIYLMENFSGSAPPQHPIQGQLWWNSSAKSLAVYDGAASPSWKIVYGNIASLNVNTSITASTITTTGAITGLQHIGYHTGAIGANTPNTAAFTTVTATSIASAFNGTIGAVTPNTGAFTDVTASGNIQTTSGNVVVNTGNYYVGNGYYLTGVVTGGASTYSNSNVAAYLPTYSGNVGAASVNASFLYGNGYYISGLPANYGNTQVAAYLTTNTGNIAAGNISVSSDIYKNGTRYVPKYTSSSSAPANPVLGDLWYDTSADITYLRSNDGVNSFWLDFTTEPNYFANLTASNFTVVNSIVPSANVAVTLGNSSFWWSTIYGQAIQAKYADLAECYMSDAEYTPGTVVVFGGEAEITTTQISHDERVAGVISTNPAYLMNTGNGLPVALQGRVPCQVRGPVSKGQSVVSSEIPGVAQALNKIFYTPGCVIGKSLENITDNSIQTIEIVVGRL